MLDYWKGVHPDSGKVWSNNKDIIIKDLKNKK